jgi:glycosyltransferase involved in cell wall biosynthesis
MTRPIRILYDIHPHTLGGTERFLARFVEHLDETRFEPVVISQKKGPPYQLLRSTGIRTEVVADYAKPGGLRRLAEFIRLRRIGLVQSNYYSSYLAMAANLAGVPHIWRLGGHVSVGGGVRTRRDAQLALHMIRLLSRAIICNSNYVRSQFPRRAVAPPIQVIQNGIPTPSRASRVKSNGQLRIGMVAHLIPQKRHLDFINAAEIVSRSREDVSFAIFGTPYADPASRSYANRVRGRAGGLRQQGRLSISEYVSRGNSLPRAFDVLVLPSLRESFSNAILEAMADGIPVIAARSGGHPELVDHRKTGLLVPPMQPEALARAIMSLIKNPKLMAQMGEAARERARTRFPIGDCVRRYEAIYESVIAGSD